MVVFNFLMKCVGFKLNINFADNIYRISSFQLLPDHISMEKADPMRKFSKKRSKLVYLSTSSEEDDTSNVNEKLCKITRFLLIILCLYK